MHDFCFTIPYGFLVLVGGVFGFLKKGSTVSFMGGVGSGLLLLFAGYQSLQAFHAGSNSWVALILQTAVSMALTGVMGFRFTVTGKFMPAGLIVIIGGFMTLFYFLKIAKGGNEIPKKAVS